MATATVGISNSVEISDNFKDLLTCSICLETFKDPRYLPCLHTFCQSCLHTYIQSLGDKNQAVSEKSIYFHCPICQIRVNVGSKSDGQHFPVNHFVHSLLDAVAIQKNEKNCDSCHVNGSSSKAVSWCSVCEEAFCENCEKYHKSFKISAQHQLLPLTDASSQTFVAQYQLICEKHSSEVIKFYCIDHSQALCSVCATLSHRKCDVVISIEEAASNVKKSEKAVNLSIELKDSCQLIEELIMRREENKRNFEQEMADIKCSVGVLTKGLKDRLEKLEFEFDAKLSSVKKEHVFKQEQETVLLTNLQKRFENFVNIIDTCSVHGSEPQFLLELDKIAAKKSDLSDEVKKLCESMKCVSVKFVENTDFRHISGITDLGEIAIKMEDMVYPTNKFNFQTGELKVTRVLQLPTSTVQICGCYTPKNLILGAWDNNKIYKYDDDGNLQCEMQTPNNPFDISIANDSEISVSFGNKQVILVNYESMTNVRTISSSVDVYGIQYLSTQLIGVHDQNIYHIDINTGALISTKTSKGENWYVFATSENDFIHADGPGTIVHVKNNSEAMRFNDHSLRNPRGIYTDIDGNIYVCGYTSGLIYQISKDGKLIRTFEAKSIGLEEPWVVNFKKNSNQFIITCYETGKVALCSIG